MVVKSLVLLCSNSAYAIRNSSNFFHHKVFIKLIYSLSAVMLTELIMAFNLKVDALSKFVKNVFDCLD